MSDWQVGDLAVCVDDAPHPTLGPARVRAGCVYRVTGVVIPPAPHPLFGDRLGLVLEGMNAQAPWGFAASRFRKIRPDEREACEPEFVTLLKRSRSPAKVE